MTCKACTLEAPLVTEKIPHPIDPRLHTCDEGLVAANERARDVRIARQRFIQETAKQLLPAIYPEFRSDRLSLEAHFDCARVAVVYATALADELKIGVKR